VSRRDDLYFIESPALHRIKIGRGNPGRRLAAFSTGSPDPDLRIMWLIPGAGAREKDVHRAWAASWSHGEWFNGTPELREWIDGGADLDELPDQFTDARGLRSNVSHKHDPTHIDGLLNTLREHTAKGG
jgi:hypothetical protein